MSVRMMALVFGARFGSRNNVTPAVRKSVALKLADYASDDGSRVFPSVATIAAQTEISERTVQRALTGFVEEGLLKIVRKGGGRHTTEYAFDLTVLLALPPTGDTVTPVKDPRQGVTGVSKVEKPVVTGVTVSPKPSRRIHQARSRTRAEDLKSILKSEGKTTSVVVRRTDWGFRFWLDHLRRHGHRKLVDEIDRCDAMLAPSACPTGRDQPLPSAYRASS